MRSRNRSLLLVGVPVLFIALLAVGFPLLSRTGGFFPSAQSRATQKPAVPAQPDARPFIGSLGQTAKLDLNVARRNHSATALADGSVLIVGGDNQNGAVGEAELLDPKASTLIIAASSLTARAKHAATLLSNGKLLITGGVNQGNTLNSTEVFDPSTNAFAAGPRLQRPRTGHSATSLGNGMVLIAGGQGEDSAELYDPNRNQSILLSGKLTAPRSGHSTVLLQDGGVLLAGGDAGNSHNLESAEIYDPFTQTFSATPAPMLLGRARASLRLLPDGKVQVIGGDNDGTMEVYDPADLPAGAPGQMYNHSLAAMPNGMYSYAVTSGSLPPGLTLYGSLGMIFGYPAQAGTFTFTVTATDANHCAGSKQYSLTVGGAAVTSLVFGDFDGDGKMDLAVFRCSTGQ